jgi:hypothetical protein
MVDAVRFYFRVKTFASSVGVGEHSSNTFAAGVDEAQLELDVGFDVVCELRGVYDFVECGCQLGFVHSVIVGVAYRERRDPV